MDLSNLLWPIAYAMIAFLVGFSGVFDPASERLLRGWRGIRCTASLSVGGRSAESWVALASRSGDRLVLTPPHLWRARPVEIPPFAVSPVTTREVRVGFRRRVEGRVLVTSGDHTWELVCLDPGHLMRLLETLSEPGDAVAGGLREPTNR